MKMEGDGQLLRVYVGEHERWHGLPLYEAILRKVHESGVAGATVLRGVSGFGIEQRIHTTKILRLSENLPVVIEIVDKTEHIQRILPAVDEMVGEEGLITLENVQIIGYHPKRDSKSD